MKIMEIGSSGISTSLLSLGAWAIGEDSAWGHNDDAARMRADVEAIAPVVSGGGTGELN